MEDRPGKKIVAGTFELVWSYVLEDENSRKPLVKLM